jgi:phosphomannomutase
MAVQAELRATVEAWIDDDPDEQDREELRALLDRAAADDAAAVELRDRFTGRLTFGTAGLRGVMGAGPNRMNRAVVRAATAAVAGWLTESVATPAVAVGCDARHRSAEFADEVARVLAGAGIRVLLLPRPGPTPLLAFAVRRLAAGAGIMITASHNPATDNGYKLYLSDGAQVIPPVDAEIESRITRLGPLTAIPAASLEDPLIVRLGDEVAEAYLKAVTAPLAGRARAAEPRLAVVYTPVHGVAGDLMLRAMDRAGFAAPHVVAAQAAPDPDFPTARFPNPEEPGVLDLALADAQRQGADLVLASDPDGDRLAAAWPGAPGAPAVTADGAWRMLTGDQLGALLGAYLLETEGARLTSAGIRPLVATTIVSSTLLSKIAAATGASYRETLTGFKWIARAADDIDTRGGADVQFVFGYEEALGYLVGQVVRDKDGIGAALTLLSLAAAAKLRGRTLHDAYDDLERAHGVHLTEQLTLPIPGTAAVMRRIRATPPSTLGGFPVQAVTDYAGPGTGLPRSDVLSYTLPQARVAIRPSGTEPKVKAYLEVVEPAGDDLAAARGAAADRMTPLRASVTVLLTA